MEQVEASIERYLSALETADRQEGELTEAKSARLKDKIGALREQMRKYKALEVAAHAAPDKQISLTDPDARSMATSGKDTGMVGYNVQAAVDAKHHLIVAHKVTNIGNDRSQLPTMAKQAQEATGVRELTAIADRGYFKGEEILACEATGVTPLVSEAADLRRQGGRPVWQTGFRLRRGRRRLSLSCRREADLAILECRGGTKAA